jgi:uncharacterized protein (DUF2126 family)/transglutaminase-like putative cysteine protease
VSIRVAIEHRTVYRYDRPVQLGPQTIRLRPAPHTRTPILAYSLTVEPEEHFVNWQQDPAANHLARFVFAEPTREFSVTVDLVAEMTAINPFDFFVDEYAKDFPFAYSDALAHDLAPYLDPPADSPLLDRWLSGVKRERKPIIDFLVELNQRVAADVAYSVRMEAGVQSPEATLASQIGSCRDSGWLLVAILRRLGIAARFASGYLVQLAQDRPAAADTGANVDFTDLHAWAEAYIPGAGWVGFDATSGLAAGEGHIPLACTSLPAQAAPIEGSFDIVFSGPAGHPAGLHTDFEYTNVVRRIEEPPRVTLPYTAQQWTEIDALGEQVDETLAEGDVRLTMGGEPTYVSADAGDHAAPEWNISATGGTKEPLATALTEGLATAFAPGGVVLHEQGKWYPGEPLPRWAQGIYWRTDEHPLWRDRSRLANPFEPGTATIEDAARLATSIADALGLPEEVRHAAYEDPYPALFREALEPDDGPASEVDPLHGRELGAQRGYALPLRRDPGDPTWSTGRWHIRREHLYLLEGDSPMGLRLPLSSLTHEPEPLPPSQSLFREVGPLGTRTDVPPAEIKDPPPITALCIELRDGHIRVFLPPMEELAYAAELLLLVERTLADTGLTAVLEGYAPPRDTRMSSLTVTPDPGVIEVNIHPSATWPELVEKTQTLADLAEEVGLRSEKFALDGTHTGTGGGAHITLGGTSPADSPLLRRPSLLTSMITFWQHHPSLSYLFSGRFVGPTSQAPRVDEARHESLYELEIAFSELERLSASGAPVPAWRVDRALRNLLTDLTGNTHRAEFCIDKLYSPDREAGRLGILELRGFEMPPHPQMTLVQALLVRALVARLWAEPYRGRLIRWGTELHDRFLLPWYVAADIATVVDDLRAHGFDFDPDWLAPFLEFRFPRLGDITVDDVTLELRGAIEPWNVLGEEPSSGTARYVDSSLERLQVKLTGMTPERYVVTCNGRRIPLQATETPGTYVAGVRYQAWQPPSALHPSIAVHSPLTFDIIDRWSSRSLGGCRYHVVDPGGRAHERYPVNAAEATSRRGSRFEPRGHTPGPVELAPEPRGGEYPRTLDLRRPV